MRRLRLERLARCRSSCLTLIQSCRMLRMSKPCPIATSRCNTLAQICAVSLSNIPGRETNSGSETSRSLAFTARQHLANQLHTFRRDNGFSASLRCCCRVSGTPLARARCAIIPFRLRRKFPFCSCNHQFTGRADGRIRGNQPRLIRRIIFTTHHLSIFLLLTHFASVPASHSLVKRCFRIRPVFSFGRNRKILRTYANELLPVVHLRTLATQDDHFSCGFSSVITALLFLHPSKENASVLSLHCFTALHAFVKIYNRD